MMSYPAKKAYKAIAAKRNRPWKGEEEVRIAWVSALEAALNIHFDAERARKDSSYNNVIIEFKAPGLFKGSKCSAKFKEATEDRLLPYIKKDAAKSGLPEDDYIGIAIDGEHVCFAQVRNGGIQSQHLVPFSEYAITLVIEAIKAETRRAITVDNLLADFGHGGANAQALMQAISDALAAELSKVRNSKIKMLFEEWRTLYGQVADMSVLQAEVINGEMGIVWKGNKELSMPARLFVIHTFNSVLIKLLAAEIISAHDLTSSKQPAQTMAAMLNDNELLDTLDRDIEHAGIFDQAGIHGFVEEAIFSWYLDVARQPKYAKKIIPPLRRVLALLSMYRTDRMTHIRDVLRDLYQGLVPSKLRQSLGEFYTPDWLVDFSVAKAKRGSWLDKRVLDPTCGSGSFLIAVARLIKKEAVKAGWNSEKTVQHLCSSVWGFDLNPLAVQTARVNFLMEIAGLLKDTQGQELEVPILLADAIYSPAPNPQMGEDIVKYQIGSQVAGLDITLPSPLAFDRIRFDQIFAQMGESIEDDLEYKDAEAKLISSNLVAQAEAEAWQEPLKHTYDQVLSLHRKQWNGIWFRVVRNFFWSATAGHFDCIVGNPPWVRWSKLPDAYRERVKPTCEKYDIFSKNKRHGGNELDISAMITYTTADKWLKEQGRLVFVITGTLFKNPSSAGFRNFKLEPENSDSLYLAPVSVDDMKQLKPFDDASNHTTVAVFNKSKKPAKFPVRYRVWDNKEGFSRAIPVSSPLSAVKKRVAIANKEAAPADGEGSPWAILSNGRFKLLSKISGKCEWFSGRKGITTDLNGVYFVPVTQDNGKQVEICSRPEAGKKDIGVSRTSWVEPTLLYPLIKGAGDFEACYLRLDNPEYQEQKLYTFVPNKGIDKTDYVESENAMNAPALKRTKAWFNSYKTLLQSRSTYRRQMPGAPFYDVYNVGNYTFQPWKVIWPEMAKNFYAAVAGASTIPIVGSRPYVPDHKVYFVGFDRKRPAYFLCGLLNSPMVREWIESHTVSIQMGDVFKHMKLPQYIASDSDHTKLSRLVERSHSEHEKNKRIKIIIKIESLAEKIINKWIATNKPG
jgi:hypothetical protein